MTFCLLMGSLFAQELEFSNGVKLDLKTMKKVFKVYEVERFNDYINRPETYYAFSAREVLSQVYGPRWIHLNNYVQVEGTDKYKAIINTYKFRFSAGFIAFKKKNSRIFNTVFEYNKIVDLSPFFLIWKESYKDGDLRRTDHWVYKLKKISVFKSTPLHLMPKHDASTEVFSGYDNYLKQCIQCHAIDGFGGTKSFNIFKGDYLNKEDKYLMRFISHPRYFKKGAKMPPFPLKIKRRTNRIKNIVKYIRYMEKRDMELYKLSLPKGDEREKYFIKLKTIIDNLE